MSDQFVIVGGGLAAGKAAETLREEGFDGRVVLVAAEPEQPYERPPLSKKYLMGKAPREEVYVDLEGRDVEVRTGTRATALDPEAHALELSDGETLAYDRVLLATGAVPRRPPIPGVEHTHVLRTLADADALRERFSGGDAVAIIGAGWIGCEVAAAAREHGVEVTLIEAGRTPLERVLGPQLGTIFADLHRANGVHLITEASVEGIDPDGVALAGGATIEAGTVVLGVGVAPDVELAEAAGLSVDDGIVVDEHLRASAPDVFAAGDVASAFHPLYGRHVRVEHWANALNQGVAAAKSMLDRGEPYDRLPYFFSDQYDLGLEYAGLHGADDRLVVHGERPLIALWVGADERVTAGMHIDDWDAIEPIKALIGKPYSASAMAEITGANSSAGR